jgi:hypothetical protein
VNLLEYAEPELTASFLKRFVPLASLDRLHERSSWIPPKRSGVSSGRSAVMARACSGSSMSRTDHAPDDGTAEVSLAAAGARHTTALPSARTPSLRGDASIRCRASVPLDPRRPAGWFPRPLSPPAAGGARTAAASRRISRCPATGCAGVIGVHITRDDARAFARTAIDPIPRGARLKPWRGRVGRSGHRFEAQAARRPVLGPVHVSVVEGERSRLDRRA